MSGWGDAQTDLRSITYLESSGNLLGIGQY